jgi:hypothetical protein
VKSFALVALALLAPVTMARPATVPASCVAHTSFDGSVDASGDYRCAGMAIQFHTSGVAHSPAPIWAGQWLFVDQQGTFRKGWCTFNRGTHPTIVVPSHSVALSFPNDPGGQKAAYLSWRYRNTTDSLTAAGLWALFHFYAADAAGSNRSAAPSAPLVPRLTMLAAASGRADLQAKAVRLDAEARAFAGPWRLQVAIDATGLLRVSLLAGDTPVPKASVQVLVSGDDVSHPLTTGADGRASVTVPLPSGTVTVAATAEAPGSAQVFRGVPASPNPNGAQTLVVAGPPRVLHATAQLTVAPTTTTTTAATTTTIPPTTIPPTTTSTSTSTTTTTLPPTTTQPPTTTVAPSTTVVQVVPPATTTPPTSPTPTTPPTTPPTTAAPSTTAPATVLTIASTTVPPAATHPPLPRTGGGGDGWVAQFATAFLVGGVGLLGTLRRRSPARRPTA